MITKLIVTCAFFFGCCSTSPINKTVIFKGPINETIGEILPDIPLEKLGNKYYYFGVIYEGNYFQGVQFCNYHGMSLLSIETKEENDMLFEKFRTFLGAGEYHFWSSGTILPGNRWVWLVTGKSVIYANWSPGQPDNAANNEKCLEVTYSRVFNSLVWNDHVCTASKYVICETSEVKYTSKLTAETAPTVTTV